jgi:hypothetical protein
VNSDQQIDKEMTSQLQVHHYQGVCVEQDQRLCLLVRDSDTQEWDVFYGIIKGFEYNWGNEYTIEVEPLNEKEGMADDAGGDLKYLRTVSKSRVGTDITFEILLKDEGINALRAADEGNYSLYDAIAVDVSEIGADMLGRLAEASARAKGVFRHSADQNKIVLTQINFN